ncbi:MAG TPA: DUF5615 family PIN-like protein [Tepidisphaeraceae bacterium]|jgi:hypothetical protein
MKLLLDECVDEHFRNHVPGHEVFTVRYMGWSGIKNGELLRVAAAEGFDALVTTDRGIPHQHNPATLPMSIVCLYVEANDLGALINAVPKILTKLATLPSRSIAEVM